MNGTWLDRHRGFVFAILAGLSIAGAIWFYWRQPAQLPVEIVPPSAAAAAGAITPTVMPPTPTAVMPTATPAPVRVYVTGAVVNSDVFFLPAGSIIKDAIVAAGGFTEEADREKINQALELQDQQQIHVPRLGEDNPPPPVQGGRSISAVEAGPPPIAASAGGGGGEQVINLNRATLEELDTLPGIGPAIAQRIIEFRESIGGFTAIEQITQVSGIGETTFNKIQHLIVVN